MLLTAGVLLTLAGMIWLSRVSAGSDYLTAVALPMVLIGGGQGFAFSPLTSFGLADATADDAGAASGLINTFHQLGSSLGLAVLVTFGASATDGDSTAAVGTRAEIALTGSTVTLDLATIVLVVAVLPGRVCQPPRRVAKRLA